MSLTPREKALSPINTYFNQTTYNKGLSKDSIIKKQREDIIKLSIELTRLTKENSDLKTQNALRSYTENALKKAQDRIKEYEEEKLNLIEKNYKDVRNLENKIENIKSEHEKEEYRLRKNMNIFNQKFDLINQIELENQCNKEEIKNLKEKNEQLKKEQEAMNRTNEIKNQIKYSQLKKRMIENLNETKRNVTKLNIEYMDVSNKITILQNQELIVQIEYQAEKIAELERNNNILKNKLYALENDLEIHKNVELKLANKIKNINKNNNNNHERSKSINENNNNQSTCFTNRLMGLLSSNKSYSNYNNKINDSNFSGNERRIYGLEKKLNEKNEEIEHLKIQLSHLQNKISNYESKYSGLFNFFEDCLNRFFNDNEIKKNHNLYINIESIKKCDFTNFSNQEKYALLILIMNYLIPIVNLNLNSNCNIGDNIFKTNLNVISKNFNRTGNYMSDSILRKAFVGKNNKIKNDLICRSTSNNYYNNVSIPILKKQIKIEPKLIDKKTKEILKNL